MKRADEEYRKDTFSIFLADRVGHGTFAWTEVPQKQEPPDYYLALCGTRFAVEVTTLMDEVAVGGTLQMPSAGINQALTKLCKDMEGDLSKRNLLRGSYVLVLQPIEDLRNARPFIEERIVQYVERTCDNKVAAPEVLLKQGRSRLSIKRCPIDKIVFTGLSTMGRESGKAR